MDTSSEEEYPISLETLKPQKEEQKDQYGFICGIQFSPTEVIDSIWTDEKVRSRESKWLAILNNWSLWMNRHFDIIRHRCRRGIPSSLRCRVWLHLCNSNSLLQEAVHSYQNLLSFDVDYAAAEQIQLDVIRQFKNHEYFSHMNGETALRNILRAYCAMKPPGGYCQSQAGVAAGLLIHMPEEDAFWAFVRICRSYLPKYYDYGLRQLKIDAIILSKLTSKYLPDVYDHLEKFKIDPIIYCTPWFMCIFTQSLPWSSVTRIFDQFFCEGIKVLFRFSLAILDNVLGSVSQRKHYNSFETTVIALQNLPPTETSEKNLLEKVELFYDIKDEEFERIHEYIVRNEQKYDILTNICPSNA